MATPKLLDNGLPAIHRFITDHNDDSKAVFSTRIPEEQEWENIPGGSRFCLTYTTRTTPVQLRDGKDITIYEKDRVNKPGIMIPGGSVIRIVDFQPYGESPMHRTVSLDYGVVLEGQIELLLDSGEKRIMNKGDVSIQRGTNHLWRNTGSTWARMLYVLQESEPIVINGKPLDEDYGGLEGVKASSGSH